MAALVVAAAACSSHAQTTAAEYETPPRIRPDRILPPVLLASGNHRVRDEVQNRENWIQFEIQSDFGTYKVLSLPMVALRVHEIRTLAQAVDEFQRSNEKLAETLRGQLAVGADSFVEILASPLGTSAQIVSQFRINVAQTFEELRNGPPKEYERKSAQESFYSQFEPGDPVLAAHKRNAASQLDLDVYSSNLKVQEFLETVAAARGAGQQSAGVVTISLPRDHEARTGRGQVEAAVRAAMTHNTINQLYARNFQRLASAGIDKDLADAFLSHPVLSPWHKTMLTEQTVFLDGVANRGALLRASQTARSEEEALAYVQVAKMLSTYNERFGALRGLVGAGHIVLATTRDGAILALLPFDLVYWNRETERVFSGLAEFAQEKAFERHAVISSGIVTDLARQKLAGLDFELEERFLLRR